MLYEVNAPSTLVLASTKGVKRRFMLDGNILNGIFLESFWAGLADSIVFN